MLSASRLLSTTAVLLATAIAAQDSGVPGDQTDVHNLTEDWYWHNRYFALLGMASYGDFNSTCPVQTFTKAEQLKNFPDSTLAPWEVLETWDTPSGASGFSAVVPEMNKILLVFKGNWTLEQNLDTATAPWSDFNVTSCSSCTANAFAVQGYNEAKNATNFWEITRERYYGAGLVFAITGHGLGGMHALIASADFNAQRICYYSHNHGTPRTFNQAGVNWYNSNFNGEAGERATWNNDQVTEIIPASDDYQHAGTAFYYWGFNSTSGQPNCHICWDNADDPDCQPQDQGVDATIDEQHYFYFANVGQCGGETEINTDWIDAELNGLPFPSATWAATASSASPATTTTSLWWAATTTTSRSRSATTTTTWTPQDTTTYNYQPDTTSTADWETDTTSTDVDTTTYSPTTTSRTRIRTTTPQRVSTRTTVVLATSTVTSGSNNRSG